jgi:DNA sulfur modification protein DndB
VIFIAHLDTPDGKVRTRRLFCDINKNAVAVSGGDKVIIDEDDVAAIVTRRVYAEYPPFKRGELIALTERKEIIEQGGEDRFTSLLGLYTATKKLKKLFRKEGGTLDSDPKNVVAFQRIVTAFFDFIIEQEPSLRKFFKEGRTSLEAERRNNKNLFFRPVGLEVLARLYVHFHAKTGLNDLAQGLKQINFNNPGGVFDGILWSAGKISASSKERTAAVDLCLYVLGELTPASASELHHRLFEITRKADYKLPPKLNLARR